MIAVRIDGYDDQDADDDDRPPVRLHVWYLCLRSNTSIPKRGATMSAAPPPRVL